MVLCKRSAPWLIVIMVTLAACQTAPPAPRVPVVMGTVKANMKDSYGGVVVNTRTGYTYIAGRSQVTILKGTERVREVETGGEGASSMAVDETNNYVYVVNRDSDSVTVIRGIERIGVISTVGKGPTGVTVEPHSGYAYVVSGYRGGPGRGDLEGNILLLKGTQAIENIKLGSVVPTQIVADPVGGYVYAAGLRDVVILKGSQEITRRRIGALIAMAVNPTTGEVFILADLILHRFKQGNLIDTVPLKGNQLPIWQIAVHPTSGDIYIPYGGSTRGVSHVLILRAMSGIGDIEVGDGPAALTIDPVTGNVYVASYEADTVTVINGTRKLATIKAGWYPLGIGVNPADGVVYVANIADGTITILGFSKQTDPTMNPVKPYPYP